MWRICLYWTGKYHRQSLWITRPCPTSFTQVHICDVPFCDNIMPQKLTPYWCMVNYFTQRTQLTAPLSSMIPPTLRCGRYLIFPFAIVLTCLVWIIGVLISPSPDRGLLDQHQILPGCAPGLQVSFHVLRWTIRRLIVTNYIYCWQYTYYRHWREWCRNNPSTFPAGGKSTLDGGGGGGGHGGRNGGR